MAGPNILKLYGADWCPDCRRAKNYLQENNVEFEFVDVDLDAEATALVERINKGKRIIPTISFLGKTYTNPEVFKDSLALDARGFITTTGLAATSVKGIFAAGDVREGAIAQVAAATGEGVLASYGVKAYLKG